MKAESFVFAIAGVCFGLIAGWILGSQQASSSGRAGARVAQEAPAAAPSANQQRPAVLDQARVDALKNIAEQNKQDPKPRVQLGNLYFDAERYDEAIQWYEAAYKLNTKDPNVSTDLGVAYYYTNQPDRAIAQFQRSLEFDPKHTKTLLNLGIVKAFGKQDYDGAADAWERVVALAPDSAEGQAAKKGLEGIKNSRANNRSGSGG